MFEHITANEIAGYTVGALLVGATISAPKIDSFISLSQRRSLNLCTRCGNLKLIACTKCKGSGSVKGVFHFGILDESYQSSARAKSEAICTKCLGLTFSLPRVLQITLGFTFSLPRVLRSSA